MSAFLWVLVLVDLFVFGVLVLVCVGVCDLVVLVVCVGVLTL